MCTNLDGSPDNPLTNIHHYDQFIIKAAANDFSPQEIKRLNDFLIGGGRSWEYAPLKAFYFRFNNVDIRDDVQLGLSRKAVSYTHLDVYKRQPTTSSVKAGDTVKISSTATYYGGKAIPAWVKAKNWIVREAGNKVRPQDIPDQ